MSKKAGWRAGAYGIRILKCLSVCEARFQQPEIVVSEREGERDREEKENGKTSVCIVFYVCAMFQHQLKLNTGYFAFSTCLNIGRRRMLLSSFRRSSLIRFCHFCVVAVVFVVVFTRIVFLLNFSVFRAFAPPKTDSYYVYYICLSKISIYIHIRRMCVCGTVTSYVLHNRCGPVVKGKR